MSQEMHVMRPARFFTGDFKRAIQTLPGLEAKAVVIGAIRMPREQAEEAEKNLLHLVQKFTGMPWECGTDVVGFSGQLGFAEWHHTRAFAAYQDHPFKRFLIFGRHPFEKGFRPHEHPAVITSLETKKTSFPNLIFSNDNNGFFFPVKLASPIQTQRGYIGSTLGLQAEVQRLEAVSKSGGYWHADIERVLEFMKQACESSIRLNLPIVIDG